MKQTNCNIGDRIVVRILGCTMQGVVDSINGDRLTVMVDGYGFPMWVHAHEVLRVVARARQAVPA